MLNRNQVIAEVAEASIEDYETGMQGCNEAAKIWMQLHVVKMSFCLLGGGVGAQISIVEKSLRLEGSSNRGLYLEVLYSVDYDSLTSPVCEIKDGDIEMDYPATWTKLTWQNRRVG
ncbi:hypothetical protein C5167_004527 [Papaver somniferum]|uniref:Uncharacterized protein n=1 Tax=Papaver somniferum TaxID=3469 RepID=A0A4Y7JBA6_PAPSO|nr:hypothetical protein C5167_004527 [Papaver somniferum]